MQYIIYTDESIRRGRYFSNFYGGLLVKSPDLEEVCASLQRRKFDLTLQGEVKWQKVKHWNCDAYRDFTNSFFDLVEAGRVKVRIMFTQNAVVPINLTKSQRDNEYHLLYYQFVKHAFGLRFAPQPGSLRLLVDQMPHTAEKNQQFRSYIVALQESIPFRRAGITINSQDVTEAVSNEHVLLQSLDIVLGAMQFRLNDGHKQKPPGARLRGRTTRAKEKLYKQIHARLRVLRRNFNIGIDTGLDGIPSNRWHHPYRHWCFQPKEATTDPSYFKS